MVMLGSNAKRKVKDYVLTRYACYLIAMNGDTTKEEPKHKTRKLLRSPAVSRG